MLRATPGALSSRLLEERPAGLPSQLFVHGGRSPTLFSAVLFEAAGPRLVSLESPEHLRQLIQQRCPVWLRVMGLANGARIRRMLEPLKVPDLWPWQLLLPPAEHQPLLWRQLKQLALLPQRDFSAADSESWLQSLLQGPHLLPVHFSLMEAMP